MNADENFDKIKKKLNIRYTFLASVPSVLLMFKVFKFCKEYFLSATILSFDLEALDR